MSEDNFDDDFYDDSADENNDFRFESQDLRILKYIFSDAKKANEICDKFDESIFWGDIKQFAIIIFNYVKKFKTCPTINILKDFNENNITNDITNDNWNYLNDCLNKTEINDTEYNYDLLKLKNKFTDENLIKIGSLITDTVFNTEEDRQRAIKEIKNRVNKVESLNKNEFQAFEHHSLDEHFDLFKENYCKKLENPDFERGILTGYSYLDYFENGLPNSEMLVIGGESSAGKSLLLNNMGIQIWLQKNTIYTLPKDFTPGKNVLYFSLEMPFIGCYRRTLSRIADVNFYSIRDAKLNDAELERVFEVAYKFIKSYPWKFDIVDVPRGLSNKQLEKIYLKACEKYEPDVIIVDYLGLMEDENDSGDDWLKLGRIAGGFHEFLRVYKKTGLTAVQLNRPTNIKNPEPHELIGMHRIGRSSLIMHHAAIGLQIFTRIDEKNYSDMSIWKIKGRYGGSDEEFLLKKHFSNCSILDIPYCPPEITQPMPFGYEPQHDISAKIAKIKGLTLLS